jgi:hypothetical protein
LSKDPSSTQKNFKNFSLQEEFDFLTSKDIVKILEHGAELWMILKKINNTACNRSEQESSRLREDFDLAHDFFVH